MMVGPEEWCWYDVDGAAMVQRMTMKMMVEKRKKKVMMITLPLPMARTL